MNGKKSKVIRKQVEKMGLSKEPIGYVTRQLLGKEVVNYHTSPFRKEVKRLKRG